MNYAEFFCFIGVALMGASGTSCLFLYKLKLYKWSYAIPTAMFVGTILFLLGLKNLQLPEGMTIVAFKATYILLNTWSFFFLVLSVIAARKLYTFRKKLFSS